MFLYLIEQFLRDTTREERVASHIVIIIISRYQINDNRKYQADNKNQITSLREREREGSGLANPKGLPLYHRAKIGLPDRTSWFY
jgi:hypothetical protein